MDIHEIKNRLDELSYRTFKKHDEYDKFSYICADYSILLIFAIDNIKSQTEKHAKLLEMSNQELLLLAGEMTAQELRTVQAVLACMARKIREN